MGGTRDRHPGGPRPPDRPDLGSRDLVDRDIALPDVISGLDLDGQRGAVGTDVRVHGALAHNGWERRAIGEVTVDHRLAGHRVGLPWETGRLTGISASAGRPMSSRSATMPAIAYER